MVGRGRERGQNEMSSKNTKGCIVVQAIVLFYETEFAESKKEKN